MDPERFFFRYLKEWRASHHGNIPANYKEKREFKELIKTGTERFSIA